ncbi:MAG: EscU/YscU/HrcU family type III secretion system export apparatus switch protein [Deltaproteobacteria bacterium]|nr:EscU/YscU/HrcU family type III secretion system export apparatus switch protein [Deltaproteobacteria bacterium]MBW2139276.1 EscU/YscU/HrcU family type III secretion system export apparatus switch protein [Deltaproteobacteria bacterium]
MEREKKAVALKYDPFLDNAPRLVAKGKGRVAEKILEIAREHDIYIHEDPDIVGILSQLHLNEEIPPDLYVVIAELLAFVYSLDREKKDQ